MYSIFQPIAEVLGVILNGLFELLYSIGLGNVGIAIILFTLLIKLLMLPLTMKQQKMIKLQSVMMPEMKAIQKKYAGKRDQDSMYAQQQEMRDLNEKYGVSQAGGCIQMLIQMPILLALYGVFREIPRYITRMSQPLTGIYEAITANSGALDTLSQNFEKISGVVVDWSNSEKAIVAINSFNDSQWSKLSDLFPNAADVITSNHQTLTHMNVFLGINMSINPQAVMGIALLIPVLSGLSQFISVKISQAQTGAGAVADDNPMGASMKMMTYFMPIMSAWIALSVPAGLGLYWIATAVIQTVLTVLINRHYDKIGTEEIIRRNVEARKKKAEKRGLTSDKLSGAANARNLSGRPSSNEKLEAYRKRQEENAKKVEELQAQLKNKKAKSGSLAARAGMVQDYNERSSKKN